MNINSAGVGAAAGASVSAVRRRIAAWSNMNRRSAASRTLAARLSNCNARCRYSPARRLVSRFVMHSIKNGLSLAATGLRGSSRGTRDRF